VSDSIFMKDISGWSDFVDVGRPTLHDRTMMLWHQTDELPPQKPDWLWEFDDDSSRIEHAIDVLTEFGYDMTGFDLPEMNDEQRQEYEQWQAEMQAWRKRHPQRSLAKIMWGYSEP
jgi:hypothetical protein